MRSDCSHHGVGGYAPGPALPGLPAYFVGLKEIHELVEASCSVLAAGATADVWRQLSRAVELLSSIECSGHVGGCLAVCGGVCSPGICRQRGHSSADGRR